MADEHDRDGQDEQESADPGEKSPQAAKSEFLAALGHLKNAADILVGAADPAVRKAASQAEKALEKVGREAEPMARQLGAELGKMTRSLVDVLEGKPRSDASPPEDESDIERLEREAQREDDEKR